MLSQAAAAAARSRQHLSVKSSLSLTSRTPPFGRRGFASPGTAGRTQSQDSNRPPRVIYFDLETTGFSHKRDRVIELGAFDPHNVRHSLSLLPTLPADDLFLCELMFRTFACFLPSISGGSGADLQLSCPTRPFASPGHHPDHRNHECESGVHPCRPLPHLWSVS